MYTFTLRFSVFLVAILYALPFSAQQTYIYKSNELTLDWSIYRLEDDLALTLVTTLPPEEPIYGDIAVSPGGDVYGLTQGGEIRLFDLDSGTSTSVASYSEFAPHSAFVCDADSWCYALDFFFNLYRYNLLTEIEELVMNVGEITPGDLAFYRGHLVFPSSEGFIKAIDLGTLEITNIYCLPPEIIEMNDVWGITNVYDTCGTEQLQVSNFSNQLFQIDAEDNTFEELLVTYETDTGGSIFGLGSGDDVLASLCNEPITETDCTTQSLSGIGLQEPMFYPNPVQDNLTFARPELVASIQLYSVSGKCINDLTNPGRQLSLAHLSPGMYVLQMTFQDGSIESHTIVKNR